MTWKLYPELSQKHTLKKGTWMTKDVVLKKPQHFEAWTQFTFLLYYPWNCPWFYSRNCPKNCPRNCPRNRFRNYQSLKLSRKLTLKKGILVAKGGALKKPQHFGYIQALWLYLKLQDGPWVQDSQCKHLLAPCWVVLCSCLIWRNFQHVWEHPHGTVQLEWLFWQLNPSGQPCK